MIFLKRVFFMKETKDRIIRIIQEMLGDSSLEINEKTNLIKDLGMDSIMLIFLAIEIEHEFHIVLPDYFLSNEIMSDFSKTIKIINELKRETDLNA